MKVAVLADIHANLAALETVLADVDAWQPDRVLVAGDVVNRGPEPAACFDLVQHRVDTQGWRIIKGNHEDFVLLAAEGHGARQPWEQRLFQHSTWTCARLGAARVARLAAWPDEVELDDPAGRIVRAVHASMRGNRHGLYRRMSDAELHDAIAPAPEVLCVGHTHVPFVRRLGGTLVVNVGAVGLPFDRDPRAAYGRLHHAGGAWQVEIVRLDYPRERTEAAFQRSGFLEEGGPMVPLILDELRHARPRLRQWHDLYEARVAAGELSLEESVRRQLAGT